METDQLLQDALKELNDNAVANFKNLAKAKIQEIALKQKQIAELQAALAKAKQELKALTLEQVDSSVLL